MEYPLASDGISTLLAMEKPFVQNRFGKLSPLVQIPEFWSL
jgi:hypothetical protein